MSKPNVAVHLPYESWDPTIMPSHDLDPQLDLLRRQYLQLFEPDFIAWPRLDNLKTQEVQAWVFRYLFDPDRNLRLPPPSYQLRVLQLLISKIRRSAKPPVSGDDLISVELLTRLETLTRECTTPPDPQSAEKGAYRTFTCLADDEAGEERPITLLELPHRVIGSQVTGFRTWDGSLHLASYLVTDPEGSRLLRGRNILELGAGTGLLTILAAKILDIGHVTATDGDGDVVSTLQQNLGLNGLGKDNRIALGTLRWGGELQGTWILKQLIAWPLDVVIGADITYDQTAVIALTETLRELFALRPQLQVIISSVIRKQDTFELFKKGLTDICNVEEIDFRPKPVHEQKTLFYAAAFPIKLLSITRRDRQA